MKRSGISQRFLCLSSPPPPLPLHQTILEIFYVVGLAYNIVSTTGPLRQFCQATIFYMLYSSSEENKSYISMYFFSSFQVSLDLNLVTSKINHFILDPALHIFMLNYYIPDILFGSRHSMLTEQVSYFNEGINLWVKYLCELMYTFVPQNGLLL